MLINVAGLDASRDDDHIVKGYEFLEENLDESHVPTSDEIEDYAKFLGMDLQSDSHLLYIAKEGLKAPLPSPWKPCKDRQGEIWYYNNETKEKQKEHPCDDYYRKYY